MSDQKFYKSQPEVLPATLPAGTRTRYGNEATSELTLTDQRKYAGGWVGFADTLSFSAESINWNLVAVQAAVPAEEDRPIQVGDWVECGEKPTGAIAPHARVKVDRVCFGKSGEPLLGIADSWHYAIMFKRVAGPHPAKSDADNHIEEVCASCREGGVFNEQTCGRAGDGKWYCVQCCLPEAIERFGAPKDSSGSAGSSVGDNPRPTPSYVEKGVATPDNPQGRPVGNVATPQREPGGAPPRAPAGPNELYCARCAPDYPCVYCKHSTEGGHTDRASADALTGRAMLNTDAHPGELLARKNLAAWEVGERRPRGNPTDRQEFERPHPWPEFDDLESR